MSIVAQSVACMCVRDVTCLTGCNRSHHVDKILQCMCVRELTKVTKRVTLAESKRHRIERPRKMPCAHVHKHFWAMINEYGHASCSVLILYQINITKVQCLLYAGYPLGKRENTRCDTRHGEANSDDRGAK